MKSIRPVFLPFFLVASTAFWLVMSGLLVQKEFFSLTPVQSAYQFLPLQDWDLRQEYHAIYLGNELVGFNWNILEKKEENSYEFRHSTYLSFSFLGHAREMLILQTAHLDRALTLKDFKVKIKSGDTETAVEGKVNGTNLETKIENPGALPSVNTFPLNEKLFLGDTLDFLWIPENLKIGKQGVFKIWNPLAMTAQDIRFHVKGKEKIEFEGSEIEAFRISLIFGDLDISCWVSPEGVVLKSESPSGLFFEKQDAYKVFDALRAKREKPVDLPNLFSIPSNQILKNSAELSYLKVRVQTPKEDKVMDIRRADPADFKKIVSLEEFLKDPEIQKYLAPSPWVQSDSPEVIAAARSIAGTETFLLNKALKINAWLHENISPVPAMGIPRAAEVLAHKRGDCNEYTVLFTAMARALGIPARMQAGLVYQNGRFFYHAWPEIFLGAWIGLDPTFGQAPTDAAHIPLAEGDMEQQISLAGQIGRIKIFILESSETAGDKK